MVPIHQTDPTCHQTPDNYTSNPDLRSIAPHLAAAMVAAVEVAGVEVAVEVAVEAVVVGAEARL